MQRRQFLKTSLATTTLAMPIMSSPAAEEDDALLVINAGIGGNNTADMLARIDKDCLSHRPALTILMAGTNDMNSRKHIPLAQYEKNMQRMITMITGTKSQVMLMTILPVYEPYLFLRHPATFYAPEGHKARKRAMNDTIRRLAATHNLPLLDMHHIFEKTGHIGEEPASLIQNEINSNRKDGVHPTAEGYRVMAVALYGFIIQHKLPYHRIVCFGDSITAGDGGTEGRSYPAYLKRLLMP